MGWQKKISGNIIDNNADYVLGLKGNQDGAFKVVTEYFDTSNFWNSKIHATVDNDHGRLEAR